MAIQAAAGDATRLTRSVFYDDSRHGQFVHESTAASPGMKNHKSLQQHTLFTEMEICQHYSVTRSQKDTSFATN